MSQTVVAARSLWSKKCHSGGGAARSRVTDSRVVLVACRPWADASSDRERRTASGDRSLPMITRLWVTQITSVTRNARLCQDSLTTWLPEPSNRARPAVLRETPQSTADPALIRPPRRATVGRSAVGQHLVREMMTNSTRARERSAEDTLVHGTFTSRPIGERAPRYIRAQQAPVPKGPPRSADPRRLSRERPP